MRYNTIQHHFSLSDHCHSAVSDALQYRPSSFALGIYSTLPAPTSKILKIEMYVTRSIHTHTDTTSVPRQRVSLCCGKNSSFSKIWQMRMFDDLLHQSICHTECLLVSGNACKAINPITLALLGLKRHRIEYAIWQSKTIQKQIACQILFIKYRLALHHPNCSYIHLRLQSRLLL